MNINDNYVLDILNKLIVSRRLNKSEVLQMVTLVSVSIDIRDLKENLKWETTRPNIKLR